MGHLDASSRHKKLAEGGLARRGIIPITLNPTRKVELPICCLHLRAHLHVLHDKERRVVLLQPGPVVLHNVAVEADPLHNLRRRSKYSCTASDVMRFPTFSHP